MLNNKDLKELFTKYKAGTATLAEMQDCINYNISLCQTTLASLNEPVTSTLWDVTSARSQSRQLLTQIEVKLRSFLANLETMTAYDTGLESLINQYKACEFATPINLSSNMDMPNFLDVNLWIRKGELMTPLNDMIWRPTKRYDEGDIVMCFLDDLLYAGKNYTSSGTWAFVKNSTNTLQGINLRPVYFMCKKGCINEHPFNNKMGKCLVKNSINYYAVEITSIIRLGDDLAFQARWFNNQTYWEVITNYSCSMNVTSYYGKSAVGNFKSTSIGVGLGVAVFMCANMVNNDNVFGIFNGACGSGINVWHWGPNNSNNMRIDTTVFPNYKTTTETTFEAAYAKWK